MIGSSSFWKTEGGAPLLKRNGGYITEENAEQMMLQAQKLVDLVKCFVTQVSEEEIFDVLSISAPASANKDKEHTGRRRAASAERRKPDETQHGEQKDNVQQTQHEIPCTPDEQATERRHGTETEEDTHQTRSERNVSRRIPSSAGPTKPTTAQVLPHATTGKGTDVAGDKEGSAAGQIAEATSDTQADGDQAPSSTSVSCVTLPAVSVSVGGPATGTSVSISSRGGVSSSSPGSSTSSSVASSSVPSSFQRIYALDAERTFCGTVHRQQMIKVLTQLHSEVLDYHQGMGFLVAYLLLFLPPRAVQHIVVMLHRYYVPGYFAAAPVAYVRDARVYQKLLQKFYPDVAEHIERLTCPEAYVSKWFIGMNIHVLPFAALMSFFEHFFQKGEQFLFQFALGLVENVRPLLLLSNDVATILAILRLDEKLFPDNASIVSALPHAAAAARIKYSSSPSPPSKTSCSTTETAATKAASVQGRAAAAAAGRSPISEADTAASVVVVDKHIKTEEDCKAPGSFFLRIVEDAAAFDLSACDLEMLRQEALEEMRVEEERRKEREKQLGLDDDDEIIFSDEEDSATEKAEKREDE